MTHTTCSFARALLLALALCAFAACGTDADTPPQSDGDTAENETEATPDGDPQVGENEQEEAADDAEGEAENEEASDDERAETGINPLTTPLLCSKNPKLDTILDLAPNLSPTQIHPYALFDGQALWLGFDLVDGHSAFDVYLGRLECDGSWRKEPFLVNTTDYNDLDPALALSHDTLLVAWHSDNSLDTTTTHDHNLDIRFRTYSREGEAKMAADARLPLVVGGKDLAVSAWQPQTVATWSSSFIVSGAYAPPEQTVWQAFAVPLDLDAKPGELVVPNKNPAQAQQMQALALAAGFSGELALAYSTRDDNDQSHLFYGSRPNDESPFSAFVEPETSQQSDAPAMAYSADGKTLYLTYFTTSAGKMAVVLKRIGADGQSSSLAFGTGGGTDISPVVALGRKGGAVLWYQTTGSYRADIYAQGFTDTAGALAATGTPQKLNDAPIAPYAPTLTYVGDDTYFTAWSLPIKNTTRKASAYSYWLKGRFFRLTPPSP